MKFFHPAVLWNLGSAGCLLLYLTLADAASFADSVVLFVGATLVLFIVTVIRTEKSAAESSRFAYKFIFLVAALATTIFWFRAWQGAPSGILATLFLDILIVAFWWPGVLFATLYRQPGDGWFPRSRSQILRHTGTGLAGSIVGILIAWAVNEQMLKMADKADMFNELNRIEQNLPENLSFNYQFENKTLYAEYDFSSVSNEISYPFLKLLKRQVLVSSDLIRYHSVRRVVISMLRDGEEFAKLDWGTESRRNAWKHLQLDYDLAGIRSFPSEQDITFLLSEFETEMDSNIHLSLQNPNMRLEWFGDPEPFSEPSGLIRFSNAIDQINKMISELGMHFLGIERFYVDLPGYSISFDTPQLLYATFRVQRQIQTEEAAVQLNIGEVSEGRDLSYYQFWSPAVLVQDGPVPGESYLRPREVEPYLATSVGEYQLFLIRVGAGGEAEFIIYKTNSIHDTFQPIILNPSESIELNSLRLTNAGWIK